jgi:hypothetical protein
MSKKLAVEDQLDDEILGLRSTLDCHVVERTSRAAISKYYSLNYTKRIN